MVLAVRSLQLASGPAAERNQGVVCDHECAHEAAHQLLTLAGQPLQKLEGLGTQELVLVPGVMWGL